MDNVENLPAKSNFQLGTGKGHTLKQVAAIIEEATQRKTNINWGGKPYRPSDVMYAVAELKNSLFVFNPIDIHLGVNKYLQNNG